MNKHFSKGFEKRAVSFPNKAVVKIKKLFTPANATNVKKTEGLNDRISKWYHDPVRKGLTAASMGTVGVGGAVAGLYGVTHSAISNPTLKNEW